MDNGSVKVNILELKSRLQLTIFGSYDKEALDELVQLRECLREKGFLKCSLVSDYFIPLKKYGESNDQYNLRKSIYWLENSDACIFVFLCHVKNDGVAFELKHTCDLLENKLSTSVVAIESKCQRYSTSLIRGTITNLAAQKKLNRRFFKDITQLCKFCSSAAISFLKEKKYVLMDRDG